ncbi:MAG: SpoIIE family protein phosphatase [Chloroflexota bacterium]
MQPSMMTDQPDNALPMDQTLLSAVRSVGKRQAYPAGHVLAEQGQVEHCFYVIEDGVTTVTRIDEDGNLQELNKLGPSSYFGEMGLLDDSPRFATVKAHTDVVVLEVDEDGFATLVNNHPALVLNIVQRVLGSFRQLDSRTIESLRQKNTLLEKAYRELQAAQAQLIEKERLEREMELAADVQRRLLPGSLPNIKGLSFAAYLDTARMVGGDLYDIHEVDDDHVAILLADVADKGLQAALFMAVTRTLFFQESQHALSPSAVALRVHQGLMAIGGADDGAYNDVFVTAFYGVLTHRTGELRYVRAAQDRPIVLHSGRLPQPLPGDGRFLGMLDGLELEEYSVTLEAGEALLMMSDGVPDAHNHLGEAYGNERLNIALQSIESTNAEDVVQSVLTSVHNWMGDTPLFDDMTLVALSIDSNHTQSVGT